MDIPLGLWVRVCEFASPYLVAKLLDANPRFQLDFRGMPLTTVWLRRRLDNETFEPVDRAEHAVLPFAALCIQSHTLPAATEPIFHRVVHFKASVFHNTSPVWPPSVRSIHLEHVVREVNYGKAGFFPNSATTLTINSSPSGGLDPGWCSPFLRELSISVHPGHVPTIHKWLPPSIQRLQLHVVPHRVGETVPAMDVPLHSFSDLTHLTFGCWCPILRATSLPPRLESLEIATAAKIENQVLDQSSFPETLRRLWIRGLRQNPFKLGLSPRKLEVLSVELRWPLPPAGVFPETLRELYLNVHTSTNISTENDVLDFPVGSLPQSLTTLHLCFMSENKVVFRVGSIPPRVHTLEIEHTRYAQLVFENGAIPPNIFSAKIGSIRFVGASSLLG